MTACRLYVLQCVQVSGGGCREPQARSSPSPCSQSCSCLYGKCKQAGWSFFLQAAGMAGILPLPSKMPERVREVPR